MKGYQALVRLINVLKQVEALITTVKDFFDGDKAPVSTPGVAVSTGTPSSVTRDPSTVSTPTVGLRPAPAPA
jgi:hypothetical protein